MGECFPLSISLLELGGGRWLKEGKGKRPQISGFVFTASGARGGKNWRSKNGKVQILGKKGIQPPKCGVRKNQKSGVLGGKRMRKVQSGRRVMTS